MAVGQQASRVWTGDAKRTVVLVVALAAAMAAAVATAEMVPMAEAIAVSSIGQP